MEHRKLYKIYHRQSGKYIATAHTSPWNANLVYIPADDPVGKWSAAYAVLLQVRARQGRV